MTTSRQPDSKHLDFGGVDHWAIDVVINEGIYMNLSYTEKVVAANRLKDMGMQAGDVAERLRCHIIEVYGMWRRWMRIKEGEKVS